MPPSNMTHQFSQTPKVETQRSSFDRTHQHKTTFDAGKLIPFYVDEVLPGDSFNVNTTLFGRLATPLHPIMDNMFLDTHYFYVPNRLLWDNFKKFMGEQDNPTDSTDYLVPQLVDNNNTGFAEGSLEDYMGLPIASQATGLSVSALWHRAYNLIWNEWFRDQNLQDSVTVNKGDGPDNLSDNHYSLLRRGKRHDYFTSALPWPQKGPGVELPLGSTAPIVNTGNLQVRDAAGTTSNIFKGYISGAGVISSSAQYPDGTILQYASGLEADLSGATASTINSLRQAFQLQRLAEKDARGGTRYTEIVRSHFNVTSPDARLQRPEFLGGSTSRVQVQPIPATNNNNLPDIFPNKVIPGQLGALATVASNKDGFTKSFTEHGIIIGLVSARADLTYQSGVNRMFSRRTKYDFYWPTLAHLGEQEVKNKEIYAQGTSADEGIFGYQERWSEYRYGVSKITSKFRSDASASLDTWHLSQDFANLPLLNETFIEDNPPISRAIAVQTEPHFILDAYINCKTARAMPTYSVPGLIDHF
jgi:hypothetical protein